MAQHSTGVPKEQATDDFSSSEAEYQGMGKAYCEGLYLKQLLEDFGIQPKHLRAIFVDNQSCIKLCQKGRAQGDKRY